MSNGFADDEHLLRLYLAEIAKYPLLTADEESSLIEKRALGVAAEGELADDDGLVEGRRSELSSKIQSGQIAAKTLVESNLHLVVAIAERYAGHGLRLLDLIQEGNVGLLHSVDKIDAAKGFKFSTYATWWIRQSIQQAIGDAGRTLQLEPWPPRPQGQPPTSQELGAEIERLREMLRRHGIDPDAEPPEPH